MSNIPTGGKMKELSIAHPKKAPNWYPGKYVGLEADPDWYLGKRLGVRKKTDEDEPVVFVQRPLVWVSVSQLTSDLALTDHLEGVAAALEMCCKFIYDDMSLVLATLQAIHRLCTGRPDRVLKFGEYSACLYVSQILHWYVSAAEAPLDQRYLDLIHAAVATVHSLAAGCSPNRQKLGEHGACSYIILALRWFCKYGSNTYLTEVLLDAIWQLAFGNAPNRQLLRECGVENELFAVSRNPQAQPNIRNRAATILTWIKVQLVDDLETCSDVRVAVGAFRFALADIVSSRSQYAEDINVVVAAATAVTRLCNHRNSTNTLQQLFDMRGSHVITKVFRKYLHDKVQEEVVTLPRFLRLMCNTITAMLRSYDAEQQTPVEESKALSRNISATSFSSDDIDSSSMNAVPIASMSPREYHSQVVELCRSQFATSGICSLLVEVLRMFCDFSQAHDRDSAVTVDREDLGMPRKSSNPFRSISRYAIKGTGIIASGVVKGFKEVKANTYDVIKTSIKQTGEATTDGDSSVVSVCSSIKSLCINCQANRWEFFKAALDDVLDVLVLSHDAEHPIGKVVHALREWFYDQMENDLRCNDSSVLPMRVLHRYGLSICRRTFNLEQPKKRVLLEALSTLSVIVSTGERQAVETFRKLEGYNILFLIMHGIASDSQLFESWLGVVSSLALVEIEARELLGALGTVDICLDELINHSKNPSVTQRILWTLCSLAGNNINNMHRIMRWRTKDSARLLFQVIQKSRAQTNEARDNAGMLITWIDVYSQLKAPGGDVVVSKPIDVSMMADHLDAIFSEVDTSVTDASKSQEPIQHNAKRKQHLFNYLVEGVLTAATPEEMGVIEI